MSTTQTDAKNVRINERDRRALEQYLTVLPDQGDARDAPGMALVVSESGSEYVVDLRDGACTCPDAEYRDVECKHVRRARFATGADAIPAAAAAQLDVDPDLGEHCDGPLRFAAADGGIIEAPDDGVVLEDEPDDECACGDLPEGVPCHDCFQDGAAFGEGR
jgi:hypothetical protein